MKQSEALATINAMIGNVEHKGGGANAARLYVDMLNDIRKVVQSVETTVTAYEYRIEYRNGKDGLWLDYFYPVSKEHGEATITKVKEHDTSGGVTEWRLMRKPVGGWEVVE